MSAGKGDTPRPVDAKAYGENYDDIFRKPQQTQNPYEINIFGLSSSEIITALFDNAICASADPQPQPTEQTNETENKDTP